MNLNNKISNLKVKLTESIENTLPEIEIVKDKISSLRSKKLKQRPATYEVNGMRAKISFNVHVDDLDKYYRNGHIIIEKDNKGVK